MDDDENMTKEAMFIIIVSLTSSWKLPIANFKIVGNLTNYMYTIVYKINLLMIYMVFLVQKKLI